MLIGLPAMLGVVSTQTFTLKGDPGPMRVLLATTQESELVPLRRKEIETICKVQSKSIKKFYLNDTSQIVIVTKPIAYCCGSDGT